VGLRGEEKLLIKLAGTAKNMKHLRDRHLPHFPHFVFIVSGQQTSKGNQLSGSKFSMILPPCGSMMEGTGKLEIRDSVGLVGQAYEGRWHHWREIVAMKYVTFTSLCCHKMNGSSMWC
jgi:hypothetical protein